jgi:hypothetical protein
VFSLAVPELNRRPIAAPIFIAALVGTGLSKYTFSRSKRRGSSLPEANSWNSGALPMLPSPTKKVLIVIPPLRV